jgi:hypothetical protein
MNKAQREWLTRSAILASTHEKSSFLEMKSLPHVSALAVGSMDADVALTQNATRSSHQQCNHRITLRSSAARFLLNSDELPVLSLETFFDNSFDLPACTARRAELFLFQN